MGAKLGGAPWYLKDLPFSNRPSAILGININKSKISKRFVIGVTCSINKYFTRYINEV